MSVEINETFCDLSEFEPVVTWLRSSPT